MRQTHRAIKAMQKTLRLVAIPVRSGERVDIVLDTALADVMGARFSTVFAMMVKRK